jgi:hypothetical protein
MNLTKFFFSGVIFSSFFLSFSQPIHAVTLQDGTVYFERSPRLNTVRTTQNRTAISGATYYFTVTIPEDAGEPLQRIVIAQKDGRTRLRQVRWRVEDAIAFMEAERRSELAFSQIEVDPDAQTISLVFDTPIEPGTTVTVGLRPRRNPRQDGVYLFGVTAFPAGELSHGQFLGFGRLHFYDGEQYLIER